MKKLPQKSLFGELNWESLVRDAVAASDISYNRSISTSPFIFKNNKPPDSKIDFKMQRTKRSVPYETSRARKNRNIHKYRQRDIVEGKKQCKGDFAKGDHLLIF